MRSPLNHFGGSNEFSVNIVHRLSEVWAIGQVILGT